MKERELACLSAAAAAAAPKFTVLDRTTVGQSLKEVDFPMSGMVSDEQIKKAGE